MSHNPQDVLLYGWPQKVAPLAFTIGIDPKDSRTIVLRLTEAFPADPPQLSGIKAIHLRWDPLNPKQAGEYPVTIQLSDAGPLSGITRAAARITAKPVPNIAAYNQLHEGRWVRIGEKGRLVSFTSKLPEGFGQGMSRGREYNSPAPLDLL